MTDKLESFLNKKLSYDGIKSRKWAEERKKQREEEEAREEAAKAPPTENA